MSFFSCNTLHQILQRSFPTILPCWCPASQAHSCCILHPSLLKKKKEISVVQNISLIFRGLSVLISYQTASKVYYSEEQSYQSSLHSTSFCVVTINNCIATLLQSRIPACYDWIKQSLCQLIYTSLFLKSQLSESLQVLQKENKSNFILFFQPSQLIPLSDILN